MCFCVCAGAALLGGNDANDGFVASSGQKTTQARGKVTFGFEMIKKNEKKQIKRESLDVEVRRGSDGSIGGPKVRRGHRNNSCCGQRERSAEREGVFN